MDFAEEPDQDHLQFREPKMKGINTSFFLPLSSFLSNFHGAPFPFHSFPILLYPCIVLCHYHRVNKPFFVDDFISKFAVFPLPFIILNSNMPKPFR